MGNRQLAIAAGARIRRLCRCRLPPAATASPARCIQDRAVCSDPMRNDGGDSGALFCEKTHGHPAATLFPKHTKSATLSKGGDVLRSQLAYGFPAANWFTKQM